LCPDHATHALQAANGPGHSPAIRISISTYASVQTDDNIVETRADPHVAARALLGDVFRGLTALRAPMIDTAGRPRPIDIDIQAYTNVEGNTNIVGGSELVKEAVKTQAVRGRAASAMIQAEGLRDHYIDAINALALREGELFGAQADDSEPKVGSPEI